MGGPPLSFTQFRKLWGAPPLIGGAPPFIFQSFKSWGGPPYFQRFLVVAFIRLLGQNWILLMLHRGLKCIILLIIFILYRDFHLFTPERHGSNVLRFEFQYTHSLKSTKLTLAMSNVLTCGLVKDDRQNFSLLPMYCSRILFDETPPPFLPPGVIIFFSDKLLYFFGKNDEFFIYF